MATLTEYVLTSTRPSSHLPYTVLSNPVTGQVVHSFKSPPPPSTSTSTSSNHNKNEQDALSSSSSSTRKSVAWVNASNGQGPLLVALAGKDGRQTVLAWSVERETPIQRLVPPVRLNCLETSPDGHYLAGGTLDGRVFLWEISTGTLVATLDAHYRAISCLAFTHDGAALVTASEDAGVSVWSMGKILTSTPLSPATPFSTLSDHTLSITSVVVGTGAFPRSRIFTSSLDGTVKVWDISTTPSTLLTTFQFANPVEHLDVDPLERFLFVSGPVPTPSSSSSSGGGPLSSSSTTATTTTTTQGGGKWRVTKVGLYEQVEEAFGIQSSVTTSSTAETRMTRTKAVGGTGQAGEVVRIGAGGSEQQQGGGGGGFGDEPGQTYTIK
ncbi:hypothetical protein JCM10212_004092 [Sporobolomyces blumeae]